MIQLRFPLREFVGFKRVMGLPGETIEVRESRIIVNGSPILVKPLKPADFFWVPRSTKLGSFVGLEQDHFITYTRGLSKIRNCPAVRLAARQYFLLGDNRDDSWDSREFGPISADRIIGKAILTLPTGPRASH